MLVHGLGWSTRRIGDAPDPVNVVLPPKLLSCLAAVAVQSRPTNPLAHPGQYVPVYKGKHTTATCWLFSLNKNQPTDMTPNHLWVCLARSPLNPLFNHNLQKQYTFTVAVCAHDEISPATNMNGRCACSQFHRPADSLDPP